MASPLGGDGGHVAGQSYTEPEIAEIAVSEKENIVYVRERGNAL